MRLVLIQKNQNIYEYEKKRKQIQRKHTLRFVVNQQLNQNKLVLQELYFRHAKLKMDSFKLHICHVTTITRLYLIIWLFQLFICKIW